jgi:hypothetical protein
LLFGSATTPAATTHSFARARQLSPEAIHTPTQNTQAVPLNEHKAAFRRLHLLIQIMTKGGKKEGTIL